MLKNTPNVLPVYPSTRSHCTEFSAQRLTNGRINRTRPSEPATKKITKSGRVIQSGVL